MSKRKHGGYGQVETGKTAFLDAKGCPGVLVMCTQGKEVQALRETATLLADFTRRVYPDMFPSLATTGAHSATTDKGTQAVGPCSTAATVADEIAAELAELAGEHVGSSLPSKRKRDFGHDEVATDSVDAPSASSTPIPIRSAVICRAVGILWFPGEAGRQIDPCRVVDALMTDLEATKQQCSRFIDRMIPLQRVVRCDMEEVLEAAKELLGADIDPVAPPDAATPPRTWSSEVRVRNTDMVSRSLLTSGLGNLMRRHFRVDLERGSHTIVVEACMSIVGVSVIRGGAFWRFLRYNVRLIAETTLEREARLHAAQVAAAASVAKKAALAAQAPAPETAALAAQAPEEPEVEQLAPPAADGSATVAGATAAETDDAFLLEAAVGDGVPQEALRSPT